MSLRDDQILSFHRRGYLVLEDFITGELISFMRKEVDTLLNILIKCGERKSSKKEQKRLLERVGCVLEPLTCCFGPQILHEVREKVMKKRGFVIYDKLSPHLS